MQGYKTISVHVKLDIQWWIKFLHKYNGISMVWLFETETPNVLLVTDACLIGAGMVCQNEFFHIKFPLQIKNEFNNIAHLELIAIILAVKTWKSKIQGKIVHIKCDNQVCISIVNTGCSKDCKLQQLLWELVMSTASIDAWIKLVYVNTTCNTLPDLLSRWYNGAQAWRQFKSITKNTMKRRSINPKLFHFAPL